MTPRISLFVLVLACQFGFFAQQAEASPKEMVGKKVPAFPYITEEGHQASSLEWKGKWTLLQFGAVWCSSSEYTSLTFADIQKRVGKERFTFLELFADPTLEDVLLFGRGNRMGQWGLATYGSQTFMEVLSYPSWFLINPDGTIIAAGQTASSQELREELAAAWENDPDLHGIDLSSTADFDLLDRGLYLYLIKNHAAAFEVLGKYLEKDPTHQLAIKKRSYASDWIGNKEAEVLREMLKAWDDPPLTMRLFQARKTLDWDFSFQGRQRLLELQEQYPNSVYLHVINLLSKKLPSEVTEEDVAMMGAFSSLSKRPMYWQYLILSLESLGRTQAAMQLAQDASYSTNRYTASASLLNREGKKEAAVNLMRYKGKGPGKNFYKKILEALVLSDMEEAAGIAKQYHEKHPKRPFACLILWYLAQERGDAVAAKKWRQKSLSRLSQQGKFKRAARWIEQGEFPAWEKIARIRHQYGRSYSAFALALEARETGDPEREKEVLEATMKAITTRDQLFFLMYQRHNDLTAQAAAEPAQASSEPNQ